MLIALHGVPDGHDRMQLRPQDENTFLVENLTHINDFQGGSKT